MSNLSKQAADLLVSGQAKISRGVAARFFRVSENWGFKYWSSPVVRDEVYDNQANAYDAGFAPALGDKLEFSWKLGGLTPQTVYGYFTECVVETVYERHAPNRSDFDSYEEYAVAQSVAMDIQNDIVNELHNQLAAADLPTDDLHDENCGWLPNGKLVMIDFGYDGG